MEAWHDKGLKLVTCRPALVKKEARVSIRRSDVYRGKEIIASTWIVRTRSGTQRSFADERSAKRFFSAELARGGGEEQRGDLTPSSAVPQGWAKAVRRQRS